MLPTIARLKSLVREKVKPVPAVDIRRITLGVDPIVAAEIRRGDNPPHATHQNQIYVRRGAASRIADPAELRSLITSTDFNLNSGTFVELLICIAGAIKRMATV